MANDPTVWMRATKPHTYLGVPKAPGEVYLAHEPIVETIENLTFATREPPPKRATRAPVTTP